MRTYKCRQCWDRHPEEWEIITSGISRFCSKSCRLDFTRAKAREEKEKVKVRKTKKREKKANGITSLTKRADALWSECVKINYNHQCQYCGKKEYLNSHHLFTRSRKSTRWDIENGICLCSGHHTLSSSFSAHQTWLEFFEWLEGIRWRDWIDELSKKSQKIVKVTPDLLKEHIKYLNNFKKLHTENDS